MSVLGVGVSSRDQVYSWADVGGGVSRTKEEIEIQDAKEYSQSYWRLFEEFCDVNPDIANVYKVKAEEADRLVNILILQRDCMHTNTEWAGSWNGPDNDSVRAVCVDCGKEL